MISVGTVEQELLTLPEHLSSPPVCSGVRVIRSLVLCEVVCRSLLVVVSLLELLFFCRCIVCPSIYGFWLPLWCRQTFLISPSFTTIEMLPSCGWSVPVLVPSPVLASINLAMVWFGHWYLSSRPRMTLVLHVVVFVSIVFSDMLNVLSFASFTQYRVRG